MVAIIYGSSTMNTEYVSQRLAAAFGSDQEILHNVKGIDPAIIEGSPNIIFVTSTWGAGDLQDDWEEFFPRLEEMNFSGKVVGLVGVGDQENYPDTFCDGISHLYEVVVRNGGARRRHDRHRGIQFQAVAFGERRRLRGIGHRRGQPGGPHRRAHPRLGCNGLGRVCVT